jgi:hypothetical protein
VIEDMCALLKCYNVTEVSGDHYAGELPRELFMRCGNIMYEVCESPKSDLYCDLLPLLNSG